MPRRKRSTIQDHRGLAGDLPPGSPVWAYLRHSPGEDQTIDSQRRAVAQYCHEQGWLITKEWVDEARSGGSVEGREQFEAMIGASRLQPAPARAIVIWDLSRFGRDDLEAQFYTADLRLRGYAIISIHDQLPQNEFGPIFESFVRWKNARFLRDLQAATMRGLDAVVHSEHLVDGELRTGFSCGGFPPKGYDARSVQVGVKRSGKPQNRTYWVKTEDPDLRARVELAWKMAVADAASDKTVESRRIHKETRLYPVLSCYYSFFRSPTYAGVRKVGERRVQGAHEPYVSLPEWELVQRHLPVGKLSPAHAHPKRFSSPFDLSGRVFCGYCGAPLWFEPMNNLENYGVLRCSRRHRNGDGCEFMRLPYRVFMKALLGKVREEVLTKERLLRVVDGLNVRMGESRERIAEEKARIRKSIGSTERSMERLLDAIETGQPSGPLTERLARRTEEKARLEMELAELEVREHSARPVRLSEAAAEMIADELCSRLDPRSSLSRETLQALIARVTVWNETGLIDWRLPLEQILSGPQKNWGYGSYRGGDTNHTPNGSCRMQFARRWHPSRV